MLHCRPSELEEERAVVLDWLLQMEAARAEAESARFEDAQRHA